LIELNKRCQELLEKAKHNPRNLRFSELKRLCECVGMTLKRTKGSHVIYSRENPSKTLPIQERSDGKAVVYQVRQLLDFIEDNNLDNEV
jgi:predicted RNA binding protein YcfA (HicA-like mRNA interferase family)